MSHYETHPFGLLIIPSRSRSTSESPEFICMNCGCDIAREDGAAKWIEGPGLWLSDDEGAAHLDLELCARNRAACMEMEAARDSNLPVEVYVDPDPPPF
jgi:hypothetical protein